MAHFTAALHGNVESRVNDLIAEVYDEKAWVREDLIESHRQAFLRSFETCKRRSGFSRDLAHWMAQGAEAEVLEVCRALISTYEQRRPAIGPHGDGKREGILVGRAFPADSPVRKRPWFDAAGETAGLPAGTPAAAVRDIPEWEIRLEGDQLTRIGWFLLRHLRLAEARTFNRCFSSADANVPAPRNYFVPLLTNVAGGTFLVLDVGTVWDKTLQDPHIGPGFWWVVGTSLLASLGLLHHGLASSLPRDHTRAGPRFGSQELERFGRVLVPWVVSLGFALVLSGFVLATLQGTDEYMQQHPVLQAILWGALSHFLGMFLNVTLQDKQFVEREKG